MRDVPTETAVSRYVQKSDPEHPWFGTRDDLLRLVQVAEDVYESRRKQAIEYANGSQSRWTADEAERLGVSLTIFDREGNTTGDPEQVIRQIDPRHRISAEIKADEIRARLYGQSSTLHVGFSRGGTTVSIASHDVDWVNQAFGRVFDELQRCRHPSWARFESWMVRGAGVVLAWATAVPVLLLCLFALTPGESHPALYLASSFIFAAVGMGLSVAAVSLPLFEVLSEGARPRYSSFLRALAIVFPFTVASSVLINLATG